MNKKYKLQVHEKTYLIELEETDGGLISVVIETESGSKIKKNLELENLDTECSIFSVVIDNKAHLVELEQSDVHRSSFSILLDGKPHTVNAVPIIAKDQISSAHINYIDSDTTHLMNSNDGVEGAAEGIVKAPLVGTVVSIKINPGDSVSQGDVLLIIEAMKMENEIRAPKSGTIKELKVTKGEKVSSGDVLVKIE
ncbi:biotin/lipoyl-containing protein [Candidatus Borrarchaeum sp.]|uniref:biotin/lipoyl-containing protein n=1 Tax=Candidatus Borrarchaeum sp. TaxID=2846742 RepID=UPI00257A983C|nr:acetyl-CoA carboxylase biotin carboxyl carrier protein subunit [Candidatus Borrarchaeum sp.]